jgi:hypothetical protein
MKAGRLPNITAFRLFAFDAGSPSIVNVTSSTTISTPVDINFHRG